MRVLARKAIAGARGMDEIESMAAEKRGDPTERQLAWSRYYHEYRIAMDALADLNEALRDMNDLYEYVGPVERREWAKRAFGLVERLQERGIAVGHGQHRGKWRQRSNPDAPPMDWTTCIVVLTPEAEFKPLVAWDVGEGFQLR